MQGTSRAEGFNNPSACSDLGVSVMDKDRGTLNQTITPFKVEGETIIAKMLRDAVTLAGVVIQGRMAGTLDASSSEDDVNAAVKQFREAESNLRLKRKRGLNAFAANQKKFKVEKGEGSEHGA